MEAQRDRGHEVAYFFAGRHYPWRPGPRMKHWRRAGIQMHEVVNGPIVSFFELGTRRPDLDISEPWIESAFRNLVRSLRPDVAHIQELACLPSSLIDILEQEGVGTVMTLQDYQPLCSTLRLFDADQRFCTRLEVGTDCVARNANAPETRAPLVGDTINFEVRRWQRRMRVVPAGVWDRIAGRLCRAAEQRVVRNESPLAPLDDMASAFQRRRDANVELLSHIPRLVAQSPRVAKIYRDRGVSGERLTTLRFTLRHIEHLRPRKRSAPPESITFATLGGCASVSKGSRVVLKALRTLRREGLEGQFRFRAFGWIEDGIREELESYTGVRVDRIYRRDELDDILDEVDVGVMPSIWEEAFGYSGIEMLAKGIPLIANPVGGIVEYAREGETAWLNGSCSGEGLAALMARLIRDPVLVVEMSSRVRARRDDLVTTMAEHTDAIEEIYREVAR